VWVSAFYGRRMLGSDLLTQSATIVGLLAGSIAVGGFLGHAPPSMSGQPEAKLRRDTTVGGLYGMGLAMGLIVLSVFVNLLS
jgi:hypothetical protein